LPQTVNEQAGEPRLCHIACCNGATTNPDPAPEPHGREDVPARSEQMWRLRPQIRYARDWCSVAVGRPCHIV